MADIFFCLFLVRYLAASFTVVRALRRHPRCNTECCLSVIMMMNDAVEEVTIYEHESDEDDDGKNENEEPPNLNNLE